jgi:hypothetical protein
MPFNMMIGYDIYDCFTMEHFPLHQRMTLTTKIYCSRLYILKTLRPGCIKRCQFVVKVNILSNDLTGGYLTLDLNQPIKWADFRLDALLTDTMLTKLYATGSKYCRYKVLLKINRSVVRGKVKTKHDITNVQSRAIKFGHQGHSLTQSKMLHCKAIVNFITYHHVV